MHIDFIVFYIIQNLTREGVKGMKRTKNKRGQSTVEYVIVFTAIAAALIYAATQVIQPTVNQIYTDAGQSINQSGSYFAQNIGFGLLNQTGP